MDLMSKKASFELVKTNKEALEFHKERFERGFRDDLARQCYTHYQYLKNMSIYEKYLQSTGKEGDEVIVA